MGSRPDINDMVSLKVDNLTYRTTVDELKKEFNRYGEVGDVYIPRDRFTRESRGFAFVRFFDERDADDAMSSMDGAIVDGREIRVQQAKYGRPTERRREDNGNRRYDDRRDERRYDDRREDRRYDDRREDRRYDDRREDRRDDRRGRSRSPRRDFRRSSSRSRSRDSR